MAFLPSLSMVKVPTGQTPKDEAREQAREYSSKQICMAARAHFHWLLLVCCATVSTQQAINQLTCLNALLAPTPPSLHAKHKCCRHSNRSMCGKATVKNKHRNQTCCTHKLCTLCIAATRCVLLLIYCTTRLQQEVRPQTYTL